MRVAREAFGLAWAPAALIPLAWWFVPWLALVPAALLLFTLWFFRDPERQPPAEAGVLVSPADGRVVLASADRVGIFLNVFNVHVCRTPLGGRVEQVRRTPGRFLAAFREEAAEQNERTTIVVVGGTATVRFTLIAGLIARRIVCKVAVGQQLRVGERVGLIRFGSRVDVELPPGATLAVRVGERVVAGETVLGRVRPAGTTTGPS
ncbi:MAG TPA: phosphatidylserine decarboxylase [Candidatus Polarisedimenticolaceae bacterium]|nr:phosphatidylserine decarboxylase [Candidatus Polarisedimenticolaceae bacterium]